jgi:hypothetical protein
MYNNPLAYASMDKHDDPYAWGDECGPNTAASSSCINEGSPQDETMSDAMGMTRTIKNRRKEELAKAMKVLSAKRSTGSSSATAPLPGFSGLFSGGGGLAGDSSSSNMAPVGLPGSP